MNQTTFHTATVIDILCGKPRHATIEQIRESLRQDLEDLLNAHQGREDIAGHFKEIHQSVAVYGLNNFNSANLESFDERQRLLRSIEQTITLFEPRLTQVQITDLGIIHPFILTFQISAVLQIGKITDTVIFGTTINKYGITYVKDQDLHA